MVDYKNYILDLFNNDINLKDKKGLLKIKRNKIYKFNKELDRYVYDLIYEKDNKLFGYSLTFIDKNDFFYFEYHFRNVKKKINIKDFNKILDLIIEDMNCID